MWGKSREEEQGADETRSSADDGHVENAAAVRPEAGEEEKRGGTCDAADKA